MCERARVGVCARTCLRVFVCVPVHARVCCISGHLGLLVAQQLVQNALKHKKERGGAGMLVGRARRREQNGFNFSTSWFSGTGDKEPG